MIFHRGGYDETDIDPHPLDKLLLRATWDKQIPDIHRMSEWIEAHFGKRGDIEDWQHRGSRLVEFGGLGSLTSSRGILQPPNGAGQLIDAFQQWPNRFWQLSFTDKRYDKACYVLEAAGMN